MISDFSGIPNLSHRFRRPGISLPEPSSRWSMKMKQATRKSPRRKKQSDIPLPPATDWRTPDQDEILRRSQRARDENHSIRPIDDAHPVFSSFAVKAPSGLTYQVEIRDLASRAFSLRLPGLPHGRSRHLKAR
jgi:hypothetical protein